MLLAVRKAGVPEIRHMQVERELRPGVRALALQRLASTSAQ